MSAPRVSENVLYAVAASHGAPLEDVLGAERRGARKARRVMPMVLSCRVRRTSFH